MYQFSNVGEFLKAALKQMRQEYGKKPTNDRQKSGATRRGATHKQGRVFRSRMTMISAGTYLTPAEFRRNHLGRVSKYWQRKASNVS